MRGPVEEDQSGHVVGPGKRQHYHQVPPLVTGTQIVQFTYSTDSGTSDNGHSEEWTTSLQWTTYSPPPYTLSIHFGTSEEGRTSEQD